jgi:hypothetical protein
MKTLRSLTASLTSSRTSPLTASLKSLLTSSTALTGFLVAGTLAATIAGTIVVTRADSVHTANVLKDTKWGPAPPLLPKGAEIAVLDGDPTKPAPYSVRLKFPANYAIPAHSHPTDENVVVTSGTLFFGMGDQLDKRSPENAKLTASSYVVAKTGMNHYAFTRGEETTIVLYGMGPVEFKYVNPNDDPRNQSTRK